MTQVDFGWEAFFVFEKKIHEGMNLRQTQNKLELVVSKLAFSSTDNDDDDFCDGISCKFFGDSEIDSEYPFRFSKATETIKTLLSKPPCGVPKFATLYPLNNLGASVIFIDVEPSVIARSEQLVLDFQGVKSELEQLGALDNFGWAKDEIQLFELLLETVNARILKLLHDLVIIFLRRKNS